MRGSVPSVAAVTVLAILLLQGGPLGAAAPAGSEKKLAKTEKKGKAAKAAEEAESYEANDLEFDKLKEKFEAEKTKQSFERVVTIEAFGDFPTKKTVPFLVNLLKEEKGQPGIIGSVVKALGKLGTKEAVMAIVDEGAPQLIGDINIAALTVALGHPLEADAEDWLISNGLTAEIHRDRDAMKVMVGVIANLKSEKKIACLQGELRKATAPELKVAIIGAFRDAKPKDAGKIVAPFLKDPEPEVQAAALQVIDAVKACSYSNQCIPLLKSKSWQVRALSVEILAACGNTQFIKLCEPLLEDPEQRVRIGVVQALASTGGEAVITPLIKGLGKPDNAGRIVDDIADALARLTGKNFGPNAANWESWWRANKGKAKIAWMPADEFAKLKEGDAEQKTAVYYGLRVISKNIAFIIDISGSMEEAYVPPGTEEAEPEPVGEPGKTAARPKGKVASPGASGKNVRKIDVAKKELSNVLGALPMGIRVNIVRFNSLVEAWKPELTVLSAETKKEALDFVKESPPEGMTNVYGALEEAFKDDRLDTIYFLSDGAPTLGTFIQTEDILENLGRLNQLRKVKINTIGFHLKPEERELMEKIAEQNYGVFLSR